MPSIYFSFLMQMMRKWCIVKDEISSDLMIIKTSVLNHEGDFNIFVITNINKALQLVLNSKILRFKNEIKLLKLKNFEIDIKSETTRREISL